MERLKEKEAAIKAGASAQDGAEAGDAAMIDLTSNDPPSDKGKQKADIEMVDASDQPGTSVAPDDDMVEASARWPGFVELALVRAEKELPC
jgi:hypothetical protein